MRCRPWRAENGHDVDTAGRSDDYKNGDSKSHIDNLHTVFSSAIHFPIGDSMMALKALK